MPSISVICPVCIPFFPPPSLQAQYVFIHDALNEYITCGETEIAANNLRSKFNHLTKQIPGKGMTGFASQFQVSCSHMLYAIVE